ncbi:MAG: pyridoxal-dependent decarboxylase [Chlamydiota bacterium]
MKKFLIFFYLLSFSALISSEEDINTNALFLGEKAENEQQFRKLLNEIVEQHVKWRSNFHKEDGVIISPDEQQKKEFENTIQRTELALAELTEKLQKKTMPFFSPRYIGHMVSETLMVANLGYFATSLCNPNNCAYEAAPATTEIEIEVGNQLASMFGYDTSKSWGHVTSGGHVANFEALWVARNLKTIPAAMKQVAPSLVHGFSDWQLANMKVSQLLDLMTEAKQAGLIEKIREYSARGQGVDSSKIGKILIPQSRHYSFAKAADLLGLGQKNIIDIPVTENYQMNIDYLKKTIKDLVKKKIPIIAVVVVMGTTEEGAIDPLNEVIQLRNQYEKQGISFYVHVDGAYGGYMRTLFLNEKNEFMTLADVKSTLDEKGIISEEFNWPSKAIYESFKLMNEADSITVDPHKMGFIPYAAGAIVMKDRRILDLISYFAAYVTEENTSDPVLLGSYMLEGSKAGASAAAVWVAHKVVPLNITGYGTLIGKTINVANRFSEDLSFFKDEFDNKEIHVKVLTKPDCNVVDFVFYDKNNNNLKDMNELNKKIFEKFSHKTPPISSRSFLLSKTDLSFDTYGNTPQKFVENIGMSADEWKSVQSVYILRACMLNPYLSTNNSYEIYYKAFVEEVKKVLREI